MPDRQPLAQPNSFRDLAERREYEKKEFTSTNMAAGNAWEEQSPGLLEACPETPRLAGQVVG